MLEITVISGKGGTGKTSICGAFAHLASRHVTCDVDVDAPDLHLLLNPEHLFDEDFFSGHLAEINRELCTDCGECSERCRFKAVRNTADGPVVDPLECEGCKVCVHFCPAEAIDFPERHCGRWYISKTRFGPLVHAQLFPGEENSGKMVTLLREKAREIAEKDGLDIILSDGAPGIGCPVISSLSGTDLAVIVTEPTPSGRHDLERVADLCDHFKVEMGVLINKCDVNLDQTRAIEEYCLERNLSLLGKLPYDPIFTEAMVHGRTVTEYRPGSLADEVRAVWERVKTLASLKKAA